MAVLAGALLAGCSRRASQEVAEQAATSPSASANAAPTDSAGLPRPDARARPVLQEGYSPVTVAGITQTEQGNAVVLLARERKRALIIFIGATEALSIELRLAKRRFHRPLTHDLFEAALDRLGAQVQRVRVDRLQDNTFVGTVVLREGSREFELDARSSDAVALALGSGCPIHAANGLLDQAGVDLEELGVLPLLDGGTTAEGATTSDRGSVAL